MRSPVSATDAIDLAVAAERDRCAEIAEQYATTFERKALYPNARAMREIVRTIRQEPREHRCGERFGDADQGGIMQ
jgi:hypothetical protein